MASTQVELDDQLQNGTAVTLNNHTKADMQLIKSHSWSGEFNSLPETIPGDGGVARFEHLKGSQGSKAGLCYTITNSNDAIYGVVVAWSAPANFNPSTSPSKVYGAVASRCIFDIITWDQIEMLLDKSESSVVTDIEGVSAMATIPHNPTTKMADLLANFQLISPVNHTNNNDDDNNNNNNNDDNADEVDNNSNDD